ncbi:MAG: hypothetical protein H6636_07580 [Anaerolineales bacterium]|nr:hypothetical protein [Anaerolineales bacterium]
MRIKKWILGVGLVFALTGCAQAFPTVQVPKLPTHTPTQITIPAETEAPPTAEAEAPTDIPANPTDTPDRVSPTETVSATLPEGTPAEGVPTETTPTEAVSESSGDPTQLGNPELHATDPSGVSLASGKVQLVEFFAFW